MLQNLIGSKNKKEQKGLSIIEILVVIVIITVALTSILSLTTLSLRASLSIKQTTQANSLAQEALEAVRNYRDGTDWETDGLKNYSGTYHPEKSGDPSKWILASGEEAIDGFTRKVIFEDVYRDSITDDIKTGGGYLDTDTKKATVTVSWQDKKIQIITYFTNWQGE